MKHDTKPQRDDISEALLATLSVFTFMLLMIMPGALLWFFLPSPIGTIAMLACGACGPWLLYRLDRSIYGPRP